MTSGKVEKRQKYADSVLFFSFPLNASRFNRILQDHGRATRTNTYFIYIFIQQKQQF